MMAAREQSGSDALTAELDARAELGLAMVENAIPLVSRLSLTNHGEAPLHELRVEMALLPDYSAKWTTHVSSIPAGGTFHVDDIELPLDRERLVNQLERGAADLVLWVHGPGAATPLVTQTRRIDVLAYNQWQRGSLPQLLAAFVLPNHPAIAELLKRARGPLEALTGSPALDGYQSGNPARVAAIAEAVYQTVQALGITYSNPPASFEAAGQKVRTPEQVLGEQVGTCLDISVLVAAALEQAGLRPLIVLLEGHAFPAVWLEPHAMPEGFIDDDAALRKLIALGQLMAFDSSAAVARPAVSMAEAKRAAQRLLESTRVLGAVDVAGARVERIRPLPARVAGGYAAVVEVPTSVPESGPAGVPRPASPEGSARSRQSNKTKHPRVEAWKQKLLDTSLRNRLLNFRDTKQSIDLLCAEPGAIEDLLASGEELRLRSRPSILGGDDPRSKKILDARGDGDAVRQFLHERLAHGELYCDHTAETTDAKLLTIFRAAREALEETGTNTLCLAIGMLEWFESDTSEQPRRAPILLVPVTLVRSARGGGFTLRSSGEDTRLNVTLFEKLRIDRGITLPELAELPFDDSGVDVAAVMRAVRAAILNVRRWEVKDEAHLGLFSFAKFQMWADLDQNLETLLANPVVDHLLHGKGEAYPNEGAFPAAEELDARYSPKDLVCPLDADASQLAAVAAAADGKTFVLQGPPGTGKSQTITNLITHCISQGKRVLFVAEKAAALEVVQRRLAQAGLGPYVLELHSHKSGKLQVIEQFGDALEAQGGREPTSWSQDTARLHDERQYLNGYVAALHTPGPAGFSVFQAIAQLDVLRDAPAFALPAACARSAGELAELKRQVDELGTAARTLSPITRSPWMGCALPAWRVDLPQIVTTAVDTALVALASHQRAGTALAAALGASAPASFDDVDALASVAAPLADAPVHGETLVVPAAWSSTKQEATELVALVRSRAETAARLERAYQPRLFELDLPALAAIARKYATAFVLFAWWGLRSARKTLRDVARDGRLPDRKQLAEDLGAAVALRELTARVQASERRAHELFGAAWKSTETDPAALDAALAWATRTQQAIAGVRPGLLGARVPRDPKLAALAADARARSEELRAAIASLREILGWPGELEASGDPWLQLRTRLEAWRGDVHRLRAWHVYLAASETLAKAGCSELVDAVSSEQLSLEQLPRSFARGVYQAWVQQTLGADPILSTFDGDTHHRRVAAFATLDRQLLGAAQVVARARVSERAPQLTGAKTGGEMGVLQKELQKKRGHMPIRKLLAQIPTLAARLKPCFLMSPMSVATYLDPKAAGFDLVVFDEASQIPAHDAVGVLGRGQSAVIVGDTKQLPPTSFFQSTGEDEAPDDNDFEELESILHECVVAGLPERRLDWHYRSRHESLIAFSNHHYYKNRLNTFPSASEIGSGRGVTLKQIDGHYDKGGARTNIAEAQALVGDLLARLRGPDAARRTYGVVTFSQAQQTLVEDLLDKARAADASLEPFFNRETNPEPVIVKNLENIQGDERDVMLFSICYGPDQTGKVSMNFGPLNRDGGERRLNVAITRAREELVVYATLRPEQIELTRTNALGVKHLKTFLDYARRGPTAISEALTVDGRDRFDSPFEEQVCEHLRALGFTVHTQVGCAGYRLDIGLADPDKPGRYVLAVECDGAHYHSARSARERDRLRAQVLTGLGWRIHRIWSTDWWQAPERELEKVRLAFDRARTELAAADAAAAASVPASRPDAVPVAAAPVAKKRERSEPQRAAASDASGAIPYRIAKVDEATRDSDDVHDDTFRDELRRTLLAIVDVEAPLTLRVLARRVSPYFGIQRTSARLEDRLRSVLGRSAKIQNDVVWRLDQDPDGFRDFRVAPDDARREAQDVPVEEVANAAVSVLRASIALDHDELVKLTSRALGFNRAGGRVAEHIATGIARLVKRGLATRDGDKVVLG